jgi:predicted DNA-binding protein YlxM (UPF0122 family)
VARNKDKEQQLAKELYLNGNLTLEYIAEAVKVNRTTVSTWAKEGNWKLLKNVLQTTPDKVIAKLYAELQELSNLIDSKPSGQRYANSKEADARNKTIRDIKLLKAQVGVKEYVAVLIKFLEHVQKQNLELSKQLAPIANDFLNDAVELINKKD